MINGSLENYFEVLLLVFAGSILMVGTNHLMVALIMLSLGLLLSFLGRKKVKQERTKK